jgi:hypothetical protein
MAHYRLQHEMRRAETAGPLKSIQFERLAAMSS